MVLLLDISLACVNFFRKVNGIITMAMMSCPECGNQISNKAGSCAICGFEISIDYDIYAESILSWITLLPIVYFGSILGGIHLELIDTNHAFFYTSFLGLNWLYGPLFLTLGMFSAFKYAWWGGWSGGILMSIGIIYLVRYVAPDLAPF